MRYGLVYHMNVRRDHFGEICIKSDWSDFVKKKYELTNEHSLEVTFKRGNLFEIIVFNTDGILNNKYSRCQQMSTDYDVDSEDEDAMKEDVQLPNES